MSLDSSIGGQSTVVTGSQSVRRKRTTQQREGAKKRPNATELEREVILTHSLRQLHDEERKVDLLYTMARLEEDLQSGSRKEFEADVNDDASLASMASSVTLKKKAKGGPARTQQQREMRCFCKLGKALLVSDLRSGLDRRAAEYVSTDGLREFAQAKLHVSLSPTEADLVMGVLDIEGTGLVDVYAVLEMARLHYNKYRKLKQQQKEKDAKKGLAEPAPPLGGRGAGVHKKPKTAEEEAHDNEATISRILNLMRVVSYELLLSKDMRTLSRPRPYILNSVDFHEVLEDFGVKNLALNERKLLEERYCAFYPPRSGSVDYSSFKSEFISLGGEVLIARRRTPRGTARLGALHGANDYVLGGPMKALKKPLPALTPAPAPAPAPVPAPAPTLASASEAGAPGLQGAGARVLPPIPTAPSTPALPGAAGGSTPSPPAGAHHPTTAGSSRRPSVSKVTRATSITPGAGSRPSTPRPRRGTRDDVDASISADLAGKLERLGLLPQVGDGAAGPIQSYGSHLTGPI